MDRGAGCGAAGPDDDFTAHARAFGALHVDASGAAGRNGHDGGKAVR